MTDPVELYARLVAKFTAQEWLAAQAIVTELLPMSARHAGVYAIAGVVSTELQRHNDAEAYLRRATELDPTRSDFATLHAKALAVLARWNDALIAADRASTLMPDDPMTLDSLGVIYAKVQAHDKAAKMFTLAAHGAPDNASLHFNLATSLIALGDVEMAERHLQRSIDLNVKHWPSHVSLSQLQRQTADRNHLEALRSLLAEHADDNDAVIYLNMALAKELEDLADYPKAFKHYTRGKSALKIKRPYVAERENAFFGSLMKAFALPDRATRTDAAASGPVFVIGMPRSGTTLVDRIITSHPAIHSAGELQNFPVSLSRVSNGGIGLLASPAAIVEATAALDWKRLGEDYLASVHPTGDCKSRFVDKLPHNFLYAGFIIKSLPGARIVCVRRNPLDTCISNFRQIFDPSSAIFDYSFDLLDTGNHYALFDRLMAHWQRIFPAQILEVRYEDLVSNTEAVSRQLLNHCGLPWHDDCLRFENNPSPVSTFSALQVRSPMYRLAVGRWKHYEPQLAPLRTLLLHRGIDPDA